MISATNPPQHYPKDSEYWLQRSAKALDEGIAAARKRKINKKINQRAQAEKTARP